MIYSIISIILVIASLLLVTFNVLKGRWYAWLIYVSGLFSAYSTTMLGLSVVGSDISREMLMSVLALENGWNLSIIDPSNTSWVVGLFVPFMAWVLHIGVEWVYKVILPMIFAFTPVLLYLIFRKMTGDLKAFYAAMFFIIMPVFSLEIPTIGKSMVAETLMALTLWIMFTDWRVQWKFPAMLILVPLILGAHYTVGLLFAGFLFVILGIMWFVKLFPRWELFKDRSIPLWTIVVIIAIGFAVFIAYYSNVASGVMTYYIGLIASYYTKINPTTLDPMIVMNQTLNSNQLIQASAGMDLSLTGWSGKAFRAVQYLTQSLVVLGCFWFLFKYKLYKFKAEFVACMGGASAMLAACFFVPFFGSLINPTRYYHIALFFLSPCFVLAFDCIEEGWKWAIK